MACTKFAIIDTGKDGFRVTRLEICTKHLSHR